MLYLQKLFRRGGNSLGIPGTLCVAEQAENGGFTQANLGKPPRPPLLPLSRQLQRPAGSNFWGRNCPQKVELVVFHSPGDIDPVGFLKVDRGPTLVFARHVMTARPGLVKSAVVQMAPEYFD